MMKAALRFAGRLAGRVAIPPRFVMKPCAPAKAQCVLISARIASSSSPCLLRASSATCLAGFHGPPPRTMTHDYKLNGTTTLFAALDVATGTVLG